jgi:hypothetical protein
MEAASGCILPGESTTGKFSDGSGKISGMSNAELEAKVKQTIDQALVTEQVVDIFDAAGIQKPDISFSLMSSCRR